MFKGVSWLTEVWHRGLVWRWTRLIILAATFRRLNPNYKFPVPVPTVIQANETSEYMGANNWLANVQPMVNIHDPAGLLNSEFTLDMD